jgi:hypothetical protein
MKYQAVKRCHSFSSYFHTSFSYIVLLFLLKNSTPTVLSTFPLFLSEKGGLCLLLKLRQMGTQGVHWLVCWALRAGTGDLFPALAALVDTLQNIFSHRTLLHFICPYPIV